MKKRRLCLRITGNRDYAADAAQETFYQLLKNAGHITGSLGGWLHRVAVRRAIDLVRRDAVRRRHESTYATVSNPVETDERADVAPLVDDAIGELEEDLRDILLRHYLQGQSTVQIATATGVSQPTISRRIEQALELLRGKLRAKGVMVSATVLAGLMTQAMTSAPSMVLQTLGKMALTNAGTTAGGAAPRILSGLKLKAGALAAVAVIGMVGFMAYQRTAGGNGPMQSESQSLWGDTVEGVQVRLRVNQTNWTEGSIPRLYVDVRNQGTRHLLVQTRQMHGCQVEMDGTWFQRSPYTLELRALPSPFPPGRQYDGMVLDLNTHWQEAGEPARRLGQIKRVTDQLTPGRHTVRVAVTATADKTDSGRPIRAISNPVEIEILSVRDTDDQPK